MGRFLLIVGAVFIVAFGAYMLFQGSTTKDEARQFNVTSIEQYRPNELDTTLLNINSVRDTSLLNEFHSNEDIRTIVHNKEKNESHFHEHQAVVKFKQKPSKRELDKMKKDIDGDYKAKLNLMYEFKSNRLKTVELVQYFRENPIVEFAEPNYIFLQNQITAPNDIFYTERYQWNLPAIEIEKGWNITRGKKDVIIAVVDTGVDLNHPDLKRRLTKGYNAIDDNHNPDDDNGHGTHVAGIIASETNNREGMAGVTWFNKIMPIKALGKDGYGSSYDIANGIIWATDHGADVINLSLGNYQPATMMHEAISYAFKNGVVLVAASGNDNTDQPSYPAAFDEVISVGAISYTGHKANFSNYGYYIDVTAPGVEIPSTYFQNRYAALSGTSMASPHVAGLAGLLLSVNPELTNKQIHRVLQKSAYDMGPRGHDEYFGYGLIDVNEALRIAEDL
ncbi:S8 family peptidase [Cytobacillus sp. FJAT-54145]|uniref:S8 family peptidase n=1 Tax=Cytobacillus spartinae TaxID=3299023 RepID=A0ABW6KE25_9BACI